jgi:hypothetical protein
VIKSIKFFLNLVDLKDIQLRYFWFLAIFSAQFNNLIWSKL